MAVPARRPAGKQNPPEPRRLTVVQVLAATHLGQGLTVSQTAERLVDYIIQKDGSAKKIRLKKARNRIRKWRKSEEFRDAIYEMAVVALDLDSPAILQGIARKARAGRVDAAKLALEITGRHLSKGEAPVGNVQVVFEGLPRPQRDEVIEGEIVDEKLPEDDEV